MGARGGDLMRKMIWLAAGLVAAGPADADVVRLDASKATVSVDGHSYELPLDWRKPASPPPGAALLVDAGRDDALAAFATGRGMSVVVLDLDKLPPSVRSSVLRDLAPKLKGASGAKRVLARGVGETGVALAAAGDAFDGILLQDASAGAAKAPRSVFVWGSDAYWRTPGVASAPETAKERRFFIPGVGGSSVSDNCVAPPNTRSAAPALRALLVVLDDWSKGVKPPASRAPGPADLVEARTLAWPKIPGLPAPPAAGAAPKIDADGNETAGLRLPDQALPIATFTAFNTQKDPKGAACGSGATLAFPSTRADREKAGDPRQSLMERYGSRAYFVATMRVLADKLVKERLLLPSDADAYVSAAKQAPF
jgi:Alpha/beta hydrolase domain